MMPTILLNYWKPILFAVLIGACGLSWHLWRSEVDAFVAFKAKIVELAQRQNAAINAKIAEQEKTTKELSDAYSKAIPAIQDNAVANYRRMHPVSVQHDACSGQVPPAADSAQGNHEANGIGIPTCQPDSAFIQQCAGAVAQVVLCQKFVERNHFPIEQ
jgi:hypothetical protein